MMIKHLKLAINKFSNAFFVLKVHRNTFKQLLEYIDDQVFIFYLHFGGIIQLG